MDPLYVSAAAAIVVGIVLYVSGLARPLWRSAGLVMVSAIAGYYVYQKYYPKKPSVECGETEETKEAQKDK